MKTIRTYICECEAKMQKERLEKLIEMSAPEIMITRTKEIIVELETENIKVGGDKELLDVEFINREVKKGRGGKTYISLNNGTINYFPNAQYGRYIKRAS